MIPGGCSKNYLWKQKGKRKMTEEQYENVMRELAEINGKLWSEESQQQLVQTLTEMGNVMAQQTMVIEKQAKLLIRLEKMLEDEDFLPEPEPLMS
jgi:anion-transporting  ArsA/GET3 family ATPase